MKSELLQGLIEKAVDRKKVFGTTFALSYQGEVWQGGAGDMRSDTPFFIASTTKLFVTALVLHYRSQGALDIDDPIARHLDPATMQGLHVRKGVDRSGSITIRQLLAHTSGLPDYFKQDFQTALLRGQDRAWTFEEAIAASKLLVPHFAPGKPGKAFYADTNFQLLGRIIERIAQAPLADVISRHILVPAGMPQSYLYTDPSDTRPNTFHYKDKTLRIPQAMSSFAADGGMVSTTGDLLRFLEHFFNGSFFPRAVIRELQQWNPIFFPFKSGIGIHRFQLPWLFDPRRSIPALIGHSGLSGALAYYAPERDLYITGTVDQVAWPDTSFRLAIQLVRAAISK